MGPLSFPLRGPLLSFSSNTSLLVRRFQILRQLPRNASTGRTIPRKPTEAQRNRYVPGSFRPELFRFLNKETPTILVQSRSPIAYKVGMYTLATFCISYGVINYFTVLHDPPVPLNSFVRGSLTSICIGMTALGAFSLLKTTRIISSISTLPYIVNSATGQKGLMLRIETYRFFPIPGLKRKTTDIPTDTVVTSNHLGLPGLYESTALPPTKDEKIAERIWMREQRRREHRENMSRIWTLPFREGGHWIGRGFIGLRDLIGGDGWIHLKAKNRNGTWKLSREFDWALDNGHAFDRIVKVDKS